MVLLIMKKKFLLGSSILLLSTISYAGLYRWVDDTGKVHYSDKMSASVSKQVHSELSGGGIVKKSIDPQAELMLASEKRNEQEFVALEKKRQEELKIKHEKDLKQKQKRDKFLLSTYEDKHELVNFFEKKIRLLDGNTTILKVQYNVLIKKIKKLESEKLKLDKQAIISIDKKIVRIESNIKKYKRTMEENAQELSILSKSYQDDYNRFTELTK